MGSFLASEKIDKNGKLLGIYEVLISGANSWGVTVQGSDITVSFSLNGENFVNEKKMCKNTPLEYTDCDVEVVRLTSNQPFWYRIIY
jgi:hypothetical protein